MTPSYRRPFDGYEGESGVRNEATPFEPANRCFTELGPHGTSLQRTGALVVSTDLQLIIEDDEGRTTVYPLNGAEVSIGRKEGNTIRLHERNVSRRHARLVESGGRFLVEDLDSYNGVRINGERIDGQFPVQEGDLIEIGDYHLALRPPDEQGEAVLSAAPTVHEAPTAPPASSAGTVPDFPLPHDLRSPVAMEPRPLEATPQALPRGASREPVGEVQTSQNPIPTLEEQPSPFPSVIPLGNDSGGLSPTPGAGEPEVFENTEHRLRGPRRTSPSFRLICVSTEHAGSEFELEASEDIIGRTDENTVVVDHRSVSRNHAKLQFDGRTHKIIDLQSANGILVNGEEYAMTNLRSGDLIELGHVRFRYIPPHDPFIPTDDEANEMRAQGVEPPPGPDRNGAEERVEAVHTVRTFDSSLAPTVSDDPLEPREVAGLEELRRTVSEMPQRPVIEEHSPAPLQRVDSFSQPTRQNHAALSSWGPWLSYRMMMGVLIGLLGVAVLVLAYLLSIKKDARHDQQLEALFNQGDYRGAKDYFQSHVDEFSDRNRAFRILGQAEALDRMGRQGAREPDLATDKPPAPTLQDRAQPGPSPRKFEVDNPKRAVRFAVRLLENGSIDKSYRLLEACLAKFPNYADCHRQMGVAQSHRRNPRAAARHYRLYLELAPNSPDAVEVEELIRALEGVQSP